MLFVFNNIQSRETAQKSTNTQIKLLTACTPLNLIICLPLMYSVTKQRRMEDGGWTVFQKRLDGSVDFYRYWNDYKSSFGDLTSEFWMGLDKIHRLTSNDSNMLPVDLEDFEGNTTYAEYKTFDVKSENDKYRLIRGSYSGITVFFLFIITGEGSVN